MTLEKVGRYEIKSELGRGGMATVYRGYDPRSEREVAVKVLPRELLHADPQFRMRFEREAKIIAQLEHPSIVPVYDVGEDDGQPYFVMRFMTGGDLSARIRQKPYTVEEAIRILEQIAPGLDQAHSKGIVHRDLKPSNILFDSAGAPYISDFGIAKLSQGQGTNVTGSAIIGTPAYMAPEQAQGEKVDGRADIYAIGIILYEMLTGRQPYEADTPMAVVVKHITEPVPNILDVNPNLPTYIEGVIQRALAKNRDERFGSAKEMLDALRAMGQDGAATLPLPAKKTALRGSSAKTVLASKHAPTVVPPVPEGERKPFNLLLVVIPVIVLGALSIGAFLLFGNKGNTSSDSATQPLVVASTQTGAPVATNTAAPVPATSAPIPPTETATNIPPTETATTAAPIIPTLGGADKIAFIRDNDIWVMNVDGSDFHSVTEDRSVKFNLQWMPDGQSLLYIVGTTLKMVNIETQREDIVSDFSSANYFESFRISPDGKQIALSFARELYVVPFDLGKFPRVTKKSDLLAMNPCIFYKEVGVKDAIWSKDSQKLAVEFLAPSGGSYADTIRILDIHRCGDSTPVRLDEFPAERFPFSSTIISYSWNGELLFLLNNNVRNDGFGELGLYNTETHKYKQIRPIKNSCCYRDAQFSPDGSYVIFAFQNIALGASSPIELFYVPVGTLTAGGDFKPLPIPDNFFVDLRGKPRPVLRPAQP